MHVISTRHLIRFQPESAKDQAKPPVYFISVPTRATKALYHRECHSRGIRQFARPVMLSRMREVLQSADLGNRDELLALVDRVENVTDDNPLTEVEKSDWRGLDMRLQEVDPISRSMVAANHYFLEMAPAVAAQVFVQGWENRAEPFRRGADGLMAEDLLERMPDGELYEIWAEIMRRMNVSETDAKNSASPQSSPQGPANSQAAAVEATTVEWTAAEVMEEAVPMAEPVEKRQTARLGTSSGSATPETRP